MKHGLDHATTCACAVCQHYRLGALPIEQVDRDQLSLAWHRWTGEDSEVRKLRAGQDGNPGSPRWVALQALASTRLAATAKPAPIVHVDAETIFALLDRAREDAASGRMKGLALGAIGVDEHVTAYTFDDDDPYLRRQLARAMSAVAYEIADGSHEEAGR